MDSRKLAHVVLAVVFALWLAHLYGLGTGAGASARPQELDYTQFISEVQSGQVTEVRIQGRGIQGTRRDGSSFKTLEPGDPGLVGDLIANQENFSTKTAEAVKSISRRHSVVRTGTPLENMLEDVYSIAQFLDPHLLSPLRRFASEHFMLSRHSKGKILGYRRLDQLHAQLKPIVLRRRKEEVLRELPEELVNNYYLDLHHEQQKIHSGSLQSLIPLLNKKYLTPIDLRRIQELLARMRMVCNSTYLIDRRTHISPKLKELEGILDEMVVQNGRKMVIFSEWTTMTYLIGRYLSEAGIGFVEHSRAKSRSRSARPSIDEFGTNPLCRVFLSTDAGGTGLNLQAAE